MPDNVTRIIELAIKAAVPIIVAAVVAIAGIIWNHESRITRSEASNFSQSDGAVVIQAIADLRKDVAVLQQSGTDFDRRLDRIDDKLDLVLDRLPP